MSERDDISQQSTPTDRSHVEARQALPEYAAATALGQAREDTFPYLAAHLRICCACRAEFEELLALVLPTYQGQIVPAGTYPQFDPSFLRDAPVPALPAPIRLIDSQERLIAQFSDGLLLSMRAAGSAQPARGPLLYHYVATSALRGLGFAIDIFADEHAPDQVDIRLSIDVPARDPFELSGMRVWLASGERAWTKSTDATGVVAFAGIPLALIARLRVEIELF